MAPFDNHKNFAYSTVATAPSPATTGTSLTLQTGDGAKFPTAPFNVVIWPTGAQPTTANAEIARCTGVATDTLTIVRGQESTAARTVVVGDQIAVAITTKIFTDLETGYAGSISFPANESVKRITITDSNVATTSKIIFSVRRADVLEVSDPGWIYVANIVTQSNGSFDVMIVAFELDGPTYYAVPNETLTLYYKVYN